MRKGGRLKDKLKAIGSRRLSAAFILACLAVLVVYLFASGEAAQLPGALAWPRSCWLLVAAACMTAGWLFEGWVLYDMARALHTRFSYWACVRSTMVVQFFNNVTPSSSGGQPMQLWSLWRDGVSMGSAGSVLLGKFAVYQAALVTCGLAGVAWAHDLFSRQVGGWVWLFVVGFVIQAGICAFLVAMIVKPTAVRWVTHRVAGLFRRTRARDKAEHALARIDVELTKFETDAAALTGRPATFVRAYLFTLVQLQSVLVVPYLVCRSMGFSPSLPLALACAAGTLIVSSSFPTPGASGGAEGTFALVFSLLLPQGAPVGVAVLLWRLLTFYFPVLAGMPFCAGAPTPQDTGDQAASDATPRPDA